MTSPLDRAALADALASATAETLTMDALEMELWATHMMTDVPETRQRYRRLAALALAVAAMQERAERGIRMSMDDRGCAIAADDASFIVNGRTLPDALAALLKGDQ